MKSGHVRTLLLVAALLVAVVSAAPAQKKPSTRPSSKSSKVTSKPAVEISIYPNPAANRAVVDLEPIAGTPKTVVVTDERGEAWIEIDVEPGKTAVELATADLANGVYTVTVTTSEKTVSASMIVQH